jgi:ribosomal-protein-alanine N-acetyltransferase
LDLQPASLFDLNLLRKVEQACFAQDAWPLLDLIAVLTLPGVVRIKAVESDQMIGFVAGDPHRLEGIGWIATIGVLPEYRGRGIGRALLEACEAQMNLPTVKLSVRPTNTEAIRMYQNAGFLTLETWRNYYGDGGDGLVMQKIRE